MWWVHMLLIVFWSGQDVSLNNKLYFVQKVKVTQANIEGRQMYSYFDKKWFQ